MKLNSKYFDSIRIAPRKQRGMEQPAAKARAARQQQQQRRRCEWAGCNRPGSHRAPRLTARDQKPGEELTAEDQYAWFCEDHIREFNASYDYFKGMNDAEIARFQRDAATGHRPTWGLGVNAAATGFGTRVNPRYFKAESYNDPHELFAWEKIRQASQDDSRPRRKPRTLERKALDTLGLDETASLNDIKSRYKELVKRHHPDANGGDRSAEERLRSVIQAYDYLRKSGFC